MQYRNNCLLSIEKGLCRRCSVIVAYFFISGRICELIGVRCKYTYDIQGDEEDQLWTLELFFKRFYGHCY